MQYEQFVSSKLAMVSPSGIRDGFNGLLNPDHYPGGGIVRLSRESVRGIVHQGGTAGDAEIRPIHMFADLSVSPAGATNEA